MSNPYHLALENPEGNLVDGMQWLQGTFGIRFNAFHRERGHVFQSRYQSLLVEERRPLLGLVDYIHLNPVARWHYCSGQTPGLSLVRAIGSSSNRSRRRYLVRKRFLTSLEFPEFGLGDTRIQEAFGTCASKAIRGLRAAGLTKKAFGERPRSEPLQWKIAMTTRTETTVSLGMDRPSTRPWVALQCVPQIETIILTLFFFFRPSRTKAVRARASARSVQTS